MAQQNVGTLNSQLNLENGQFNAAITQAADKLASSQARMNRTLALIESKFNDVNKTVDLTKGKILSLASGYFTFNFVKSAIDAGDHINDLSKRTGVAVEMLSSLSLAADQSGISIDDIAVSINKMQKNLSEGSDAFSQIGLNISDLKKLSPEKQFMAIADQISRLSDDADRTRALMDIFGKSGAALAPLFADGAAGIQEMINKAKDLGIVLSPEAAARMDAYNDRIAQLTAKLRSLAQDGFMYAWDAAVKYNEIIGKISGNYERMDKGALMRERSGVYGIIQSLELQKKDILDKNANADTQFIDIQLKDLAKNQRELDNRLAEFEKETKAPNSSRPPLKLTVRPKGTSDAEKEYNQNLKDAQKIYDDTRTAAEKYAAEVDKLDIALRDGFISEDTYSRGITKAGEEYEKALDKNNELKDAAKDLGLTFSSAFEDAIVNGKKFNEVLKSIAQDIAKLAIRKAVTEPFVNFFSGAIGNFFGGARANGGPVTAGMSYDVGEFGREKFIAPANGQIVPYDQIGSGSNLSVVNNFTIQSGAGGQQQNPAGLMQQISKLVENTVRMVYADETRNQMRPGGILNPIS